MAGVPVHVGPDAVEVMSPGSATETSAEAPLTTLDTIIKQVLPSTLVPRSLRAVFRTEQPPSPAFDEPYLMEESSRNAGFLSPRPGAFARQKSFATTLEARENSFRALIHREARSR